MLTFAQDSDDEHRCMWAQLYDSAALQRYGLSEDDCALVIGNQLGSNFVVCISFAMHWLHLTNPFDSLRSSCEFSS